MCQKKMLCLNKNWWIPKYGVINTWITHEPLARVYRQGAQTMSPVLLRIIFFFEFWSHFRSPVFSLLHIIWRPNAIMNTSYPPNTWLYFLYNLYHGPPKFSFQNSDRYNSITYYNIVLFFFLLSAGRIQFVRGPFCLFLNH